MLARTILVVGTLLFIRPVAAQTSDDPYAWDDATIYRIVTDRFSNGDSENDGAYGRGLDGNGTPYEVDSTGHFLGGDFKGITGWIEDGYFGSLGVNTLQISAPYEQVHGWTGAGTVQRYAFDGRMPLDYTEPDLALGTEEDFGELVNAAHEAGLRLIMEVRLSGPGVATLHDMVELGFGSIRGDGWRSWRPGRGETWNTSEELFVRTDGGDSLWADWWGPDWIRADLPGYAPCSSESCPPGGLAFRVDPGRVNPTADSDGSADRSETAADAPVAGGDAPGGRSLSIPPFLAAKWGAERAAAQKAELDAFFRRTGYPPAAAYAVVKWVSDWVRTYGLDGLVVTDAGHVDPGVLQAMKTEGRRALAAWRAESDAGKGSSARPFWFVADGGVRPAQAEDLRVDAVGPIPLDAGTLVDVNAAYGSIAASLADGEAVRRITETDIRGDGTTAGGDGSFELAPSTRLLLTPGPVMMVYGTESGRESAYGALARPTPMNWVTADDSIREHAAAVGAFRASHPAVARGGHEVLSEQPLTFFRGVRIGQDVDKVVVVLGAEGRTRLGVARIWPDDTALRDAMTGKIALVSFGQVTFTAGESGMILLEELPE